MKFDIKVYGPDHPDRQPGVMADYVVEGDSAEAVAAGEANLWAWSTQATTIGVWAQDRQSGHAQAKVPK